MRLLLAALLALCLAGGTATAATAAPLHRAGDRTEFTLKRLLVDGNGASRTTTVGNGGSVRLSLGASWRYWGDAASAPRIGLQRYRNGAWTGVAAKSVSVPDDLSQHPVVVWTRPYRTGKTVETVRYRLISTPYASATGTVTNTSASTSFSVRYENQSRYTGVRLAAWRAVRDYCPATAVTIGDPGEGFAGDYATGTLRLRLAPASDTWSGTTVASVALHECAHERQWVNYGSTSAGNARMEADAARIFVDDTAPEGTVTSYSLRPSEQPFVPMEHAADCSSIGIEPDGYLGYGGWCDDAELQAGRRLMSGKRY